MTLEQLVSDQFKSYLFVISAPAGTGKTTLVNRLTDEFPSIVRSVSSTTRPKRREEEEGKDYFFVSKTSFEESLEDFLEHASIFGHRYGTSKRGVESLKNSGKHVVLVIDTQGWQKLQKEGVEMVSIFIQPPSLETLRLRLANRKSESEESMATRLKKAEEELEVADQYDFTFVNDNLDVAYQILRSIIIATTHKNLP